MYFNKEKTKKTTVVKATDRKVAFIKLDICSLGYEVISEPVTETDKITTKNIKNAFSTLNPLSTGCNRFTQLANVCISVNNPACW